MDREDKERIVAFATDFGMTGVANKLCVAAKDSTVESISKSMVDMSPFDEMSRSGLGKEKLAILLDKDNETVIDYGSSAYTTFSKIAISNQRTCYYYEHWKGALTNENCNEVDVTYCCESEVRTMPFVHY